VVLRFKYPEEWSCKCGRKHTVPLRQVLVEERSLLGTADFIDKLDLGRNCLIVEDSITKGIAGNQIREALTNARYFVSEVIVDRADMTNVKKVREQLRRSNFSIAVGGGTPIDVAKLATYQSEVPFVSVPTALSHDGIASPIASISQNQTKTSSLAQPPIAVLADTEILVKAPRKMIVAGYGDVVAKATSVKDWELGRDDRDEYYCERAATLASQAMKDIVEAKEQASSKEGIRNLFDALLNCGVSMILAASSRPCSGAEHLFSHFLDANATKPAMHGEQCGLGTILMAKYHHDHNPSWWKDPEFQWQNMKRILRNVEPKLSLGEIGIEKSLATKALVEAKTLRPDRYTILHKRPPSATEAESLLESTSIV
jgi:glycerol-1-phosphate dehydrogenase [NAD(P)+]